jgi:hypothetical protein
MAFPSPQPLGFDHGYCGSTPVPDSDTLSGALVAPVAMLSFADLLPAL